MEHGVPCAEVVHGVGVDDSFGLLDFSGFAGFDNDIRIGGAASGAGGRIFGICVPCEAALETLPFRLGDHVGSGRSECARGGCGGLSGAWTVLGGSTGGIGRLGVELGAAVWSLETL